MSTFELNEFGEVPCEAFINDFNQPFVKKLPDFMQKEGVVQDSKKAVIATRYFDSVEHLLDSLANDIKERKL